MNAIHVLPKRFRDFLRHLGCNSAQNRAREVAILNSRRTTGRRRAANRPFRGHPLYGTICDMKGMLPRLKPYRVHVATDGFPLRDIGFAIGQHGLLDPARPHVAS